MTAAKKYNIDQLMNVVLAPVVSEKSTFVADKNRQYVFRVADHATKPEIKAAIEQLFGVTVVAVNTLTRKGKTKNFRGIKGKQQDVKKAIVRLAEGDKIDVTTRI
jgi:large subunit ribosomal protein L23